jgi:hypothetical protein
VNVCKQALNEAIGYCVHGDCGLRRHAELVVDVLRVVLCRLAISSSHSAVRLICTSRAGEDALVARVGPRTSATPWRTIEVTLGLRKLHLFNAETQEALS